MNIFGKSIEQIDESDLQDLIDNREPENAHLEYKSEGPVKGEAKKKFLKTVSGFANSRGGVLIYGIREDEGIPVEIVPIEGGTDALRLQLEQIARTRIEPPLEVISFHNVPTSLGEVLVVYVRRSWLRPHMLTNPNRFYIRGEGGNREMGREEVRAAFLGSDLVQQKVSRFRDDRSALALTGEGPFRIPTAVPLYIVHVVSVDFVEGAINTSSRYLRDLAQNLTGDLWKFGQNLRVNFDGVVSSQPAGRRLEGSNEVCFAGYRQAFRRGAVEFVTTEPFDDHGPRSDLGKVIASRTLEAETLRIVDASRMQLQVQGCNAPLFVLLSMFGVRGYMMAPPANRAVYAIEAGRRIDRNDVLCVPVILESFDENVATAVWPALDQIWQASGYECSPNFRENLRG